MPGIKIARTAAKMKSHEAASIAVPVDLDFDGKEYHWIFTRPSSSQFVLLATLQADENSGEEETREAITTLFDFLQGIMRAQDFRELRKLMSAGFIEIDNERGEDEPASLMWIIEELTEAWGAFPTQPPSGSSATRGPGGRRSTGRVRAVESTR